MVYYFPQSLNLPLRSNTNINIFCTLYYFSTENLDDNRLAMISDIVGLFNKKAASVLPKTVETYKRFVNSVETNNEGNVPRNKMNIYLAKTSLVQRDVKSLKENGICMDKLKSGTSTIAGAGRGAFAKSFIKEGEIIAPSPLLNVPNKDSMVIYNTEIDKYGNRVKANEIPIGQQLLLNYCFSHMNSTLLLCPTTHINLINHCSDRGGIICNNGNGPNAKIQWAKGGWESRTDEWLSKSIEDISSLTKSGKTGLSFELVATSDIQAGEEVSFILI